MKSSVKVETLEWKQGSAMAALAESSSCFPSLFGPRTIVTLIWGCKRKRKELRVMICEGPCGKMFQSVNKVPYLDEAK